MPKKIYSAQDVIDAFPELTEIGCQKLMRHLNDFEHTIREDIKPLGEFGLFNSPYILSEFVDICEGKDYKFAQKLFLKIQRNAFLTGSLGSLGVFLLVKFFG